jgi:predicted Zn-dependent peptidase
MSESKFTPEEIERERRAQTKRATNSDPEKVQAQRDFLSAAKTDTPEEFQARLLRRGV